jgi:hypothetical protein
MLHVAGSETAIALLELGDCLRGSYNRLIWVSGISCSGKLVHPNQTYERDARREMGFFHAVIYEGTDLFVQFENQMSGSIVQ